MQPFLADDEAYLIALRAVIYRTSYDFSKIILLGLYSISAGDSSEGGFYWGIHGGLKYFVEENISLNFVLDHTDYDDFEINMFFTGFSYYY